MKMANKLDDIFHKSKSQETRNSLDSINDLRYLCNVARNSLARLSLDGNGDDDSEIGSLIIDKEFFLKLFRS